MAEDEDVIRVDLSDYSQIEKALMRVAESVGCQLLGDEEGPKARHLIYEAINRAFMLGSEYGKAELRRFMEGQRQGEKQQE